MKALRPLLATLALAPLLFGCDRAGLVEPEPIELPAAVASGPLCITSAVDGRECCKICRVGKACGDSCISRDKTCHKGVGCACNYEEIIPDLTLVCSPGSVERGQQVSCDVSVHPEDSTFAVRKWTFSGDGHVVTDTTSATSWSGPIVVGGSVSVEAVANGHDLAESTTITVNPRIWPTMKVAGIDGGNGDLTYPPQQLGDLAHTHQPFNRYVYDVEKITSGPNTGFWYIRSPITDLLTIVHISRAFNSSDPWYRMQRGGIDPTTGDPFCYRNQIPAFEKMARQHEGLLAPPPGMPSHIPNFNQILQALNPQVELEKVIAFGAQTPNASAFVDVVFSALFQHAIQPIWTDPSSRHPPVGTMGYPQAPCRPRS